MAAGPDKADPAKVQRLGHAPAVRSLRGQWVDDRGCGRRPDDLRMLGPLAAIAGRQPMIR
jgi:hypothetical protein